MFTRTVERTTYNRYLNREIYEVVNLSDYGFEWFQDGERVSFGMVDGLDETISALLDEGFTEVF